MYGVIDIGSNTIRLVVYRLENGELKAMLNQKYAAGLAGYIDKNRRMRREGASIAVNVLREYRQTLGMLPDCEILPFATASLRNIENTEQVLARIRRDCAMDVRVLTGEEEARFDYHGAIRSLRGEDGLLVDIGGGSTELVFHRAGAICKAVSLPIGSLSLYNRFVGDILPTPKELAKMELEIHRQLEGLTPPASGFSAQPMLGVGGTARSALELYRGLTGAWDDVSQYDCSFWSEILTMLAQQPKKLVARILKAAPERIHTIVPGVLTLKVIAETYGSSTVITSPYGVREGYLYHVLEERGLLHG